MDVVHEPKTLFEKVKSQAIRFNRYIGKHLIVAVLIVITIFIIINSFLMYHVDTIGAFNNKKGTKLDAFVDGIYFTSTTMSTVGYGDITPQTKSAKVFATFMQVIALFLGMRLFDTASQMRVGPKLIAFE
jgi:voltage-gated potassium channel Kch